MGGDEWRVEVKKRKEVFWGKLYKWQIRNRRVIAEKDIVRATGEQCHLSGLGEVRDNSGCRYLYGVRSYILLKKSWTMYSEQ
jgi:hypothetical protein